MGGAPSIGAIAGFMALFGLSQRGPILLITRLEDLAVTGHAHWSHETVLRATQDRSSPLLVSTILVIVALLPFAVRAGAAGHEIVGPMAIVVIAGLAASALANLFAAPVMLFRLWRPGLARLSRGHRTHGPDSDSGQGQIVT